MSTESTANTTYNATGMYYQTSARVVAFGFAASTALLSILIVVLSLWRAKYQPLKARNAYLMILHTIVYAFFIINNTLYIGIGKEIMPCFLHLITYAFGPICVAINSAKSWRLLLQLVSSHWKQEIHKLPIDDAQVSVLKRKLKLVQWFSSSLFFVACAIVIAAVHGTVLVLNITQRSGASCVGGNGFWEYFFLLQIVIPICIHISIYCACGLVMLIGKYEDTWSIRAELLLMPFYWIPLTMLFGVFWWFLLGDAYFPSSIFMWIGGTFDLILCMVIPIVRTFLVSKSNNTQDEGQHATLSLLHMSLQTETLRNEFLKFTTKSLCCEGLCFWIGTQKIVNFLTF